MKSREQVAHGIATALLAGSWTRAEMVARVADALGRSTRLRWVGALVDETLDAYRDVPADRPRELAAYLQTRTAWQQAWRHRRPPRIVHWTPAATAVVHRPWPIPQLDDLGALARLLDVDQGELAWFADTRSLERASGQPLRHYRWRALPKRDGVRLVAAPKPRLKEIQRRVLRHVLAPIPVHDSAHGCVPGHSVRSAVAPHTGSAVVIRVDVEGFFASISAGRIWGLLRTAGLPEAVAYSITGLVTTVVPRAVWQAVPRPADPRLQPGHARMGRRLVEPHLPQGAPTSPALANLVSFSLDRRLAGLATHFGARYTRYVDDLTFSGGPSLRSARSRFLTLINEIVRDEGMVLNDRKTVVLGASGQQSVLGAVVNDHPTISRRERDNLRALLHNCLVHGPASQARGRPNFREHLLGRISAVASLDPALGARLRTQYDQISW